MKERFSWLLQHAGIQLALLILAFVFIYSNAFVDCPSRAEESWGRGLFIFLVFLFFSVLMLWWKARALGEDIRALEESLTAFSEGRSRPVLSPPAFRETAELQLYMDSVLETAQNVTARLHHEKNELELVFSTMLEGVVLLDAEDRITRMNQQAAVLFGVSPSKAIGRFWVEVFRSAELAECLNADASEQAVGSCIRDIEWRHPENRIFQVQCIPIHNAAGKKTGRLLVFQDVTALRRLESMRRDFSANVSHELKTPITSILGFIETLRDPESPISPEERDHYLEIVAHQAQRMNAIVEDLLHLSRIETLASDGSGISWEMADVEEIVKSAMLACRHSAEAKNIRVEPVFSGSIRMHLHPSLLEQAIVNVLDNAIKYSGENTTVRIAVEETEDEVRISVQDQGIGIPEKDLPHIFERFYRVDKGRSRKVGGTGLGLSIAHHILQLHRGRILVESVPGGGSTFTFVLPKLPVPQPPALPRSAP